MKLLVFVLIAVVALSGGVASAHESRPLYFELTELQPSQFQFNWRFPAVSLNGLVLALKQTADSTVLTDALWDHPSRLPKCTEPNGTRLPKRQPFALDGAPIRAAGICAAVNSSWTWGGDCPVARASS